MIYAISKGLFKLQENFNVGLGAEEPPWKSDQKGNQRVTASDEFLVTDGHGAVTVCVGERERITAVTGITLAK